MPEFDRRTLMAAGATIMPGRTLGSLAAAVNNGKLSQIEKPIGIAWQYNGPYEMAVAADGRIYVMADGGIFALNTDDGSVEWETGGIGASVESTLDTVVGALSVEEGTVFAGNPVRAINADTGEIRWESEITSGEFVVGHELVYIRSEDGVYALDSEDGSIQWERESVTVETNDREYTAEDLYLGDISEEALYTFDSTFIIGLNPTTGEAEATIETGGIPVDSISAAGSGHVAYRLEAVSEGYLVTVATEEVMEGARHGHTIIDDTYFSSSDASLAAYDLSNGPEHVWSYTHPTTVGSALPAVVGDTVVTTHVAGAEAMGDQAEDRVMAFHLETGAERWRYTFDETEKLGLVDADEGTVYVRRNEELLALRPEEEDEPEDEEDDEPEDQYRPTNIQFKNNFATESTERFLESLYSEVQQAIPIDNPTEPDKNESYINVDLRVEFDEEIAKSITRIRPYFTHDQIDQTFSASNFEHIDEPIERVNSPDKNPDLNEIEPGVYGWDNLRMRTPAQVLVQTLEAAAFLASGKMDVGEVANPIEAQTEAYPNVYLTELEIEKENGEVETVDVNERIPRYDDVCTSVGFSRLVNDACPLDGEFDSYQSGVMVLSPATVAIEDSQGQITGRIWEEGEYVEYDEIPGAMYSGEIRHEFVLMPEGEYRIIIDGNDEGTVTVVIDRTENGSIHTKRYQEIEVDPTTRLEHSLNNDNLGVDIGRDDTSKSSITPDISTTRTASEYFDSRLTSSDADSNGERSDSLEEDQNINEEISGNKIPTWLPVVGGATGIAAVTIGAYTYLSDQRRTETNQATDKPDSQSDPENSDHSHAKSMSSREGSPSPPQGPARTEQNSRPPKDQTPKDYCPHCGTHLLDNAIFCHECGRDISK